MTIISDTKITLKVGQTTITILPNSVEIKTGKITLDGKDDILITSKKTVSSLTDIGTTIEASPFPPVGYAGSQ